MGKVLIVAYYFPPVGGGGVQRTAKFVKYLKSFGWMPVVLTTKNPDFDVFDYSLLNDIPADVNVYKAYSFDPVRWYRLRQYGANSLFDDKDSNPLQPGRNIFVLLTTPISKFVKYILNNFVLIPDDYIGWIPFAVVNGWKVVRKEKVDVIYATGKPWSSFIIAFLLRWLTGKPYVLDLRDPWSLTPYYCGRVSIYKRFGERFWERICFAHAKKIINVNKQINDSYIDSYPSIPSEKFAYITHGYDEDDFKVAGRKKKAESTFTISYVGTLYPYASPKNFLLAVKNIIKDNTNLAADMDINFVGIVPRYVKSLIEDNGLRERVKVINYLSHRESIEYMLNADVLLLLLNKTSSKTNAQISTGKLFEYLASLRPILALIPKDTDAARLIDELRAGKVVDPDDMNAVIKAINDFYIERSAGTLRGGLQDISRYTRRNLTRQLASTLDDICRQ